MNYLFINASELVTFVGSEAKHGKEMADMLTIKNGCLVTEGERIKSVFALSDIDKFDTSNCKIIDCTGKTITAGFIDCHTHFVFGGYREQEFCDRLQGVSYMDIMKRGGGIVNTVNATRQASYDELYIEGLSRLKQYLAYGVTTLEGKSGYGLDVDCELKQLNVMEQLALDQPIDIVQTYMGAHATPKEMSKGEYVDYIINSALPIIKKNSSAEFCDCFCEDNVFSVEECRKILSRAKELGFKLKIHAEEVVELGGSALATELGATSAEHLLKISKQNIDKLASSQVVGVLLPATAFSLKGNYAPARDMIDSGCAVAVASDLNPGSCYTNSLPLLIALSTMYMGMSIEETICAITLNAACAICRSTSVGTLEVGKFADIAIHSVPSVKFLSYNFAVNQVEMVVKKGKVVYTRQKI
ncbi:MAG: imidazolonepropionase [Clostridia bacterium]